MPESGRKSTWRESVKPPLIFSATLGAIAFVVTLFTATGGQSNTVRWDLAWIAFGIAFITSLVIAAMLMMVDKPNPDHLSAGSGVHRSSDNPDSTRDSGSDSGTSQGPDSAQD